ncbi:hypothetical protein PG301_29100 [Parageobacillus sp. G301]|nr:hypothetical protein PG301_29100 [Parageobacillus sp. G301]
MKENLKRTLRMVTDNQDKTVRMPNELATVKMGEQHAKTAVMENTDSFANGNGYIQIGDMLNGKYKIVDSLTYNTGEATLFLCEYEGDMFVAKVYHKNFQPKDEVKERIRSIQSKYVISVLEDGIDEKSKRYFEILPYYKNGDLTKHSSYTWDFIFNVVVPSVNEGLHAIHQAGIVHRDIKPNNIFFSNDSSYLVLGDFGISSTLGKGSVVFTRNANRTDGYAAPEVYNQLICKENDYYSFGITLLELALGEYPFKGLTPEQIMKVTISDPLHIPAHIPERLAKLIKGLTRKDRNIRWGYEEVKKWLNGEDVYVGEDKITRNIRPYRFAGKDIQTLEELTLAFASNWEEGKKHLYRGLTKDFVKQFGEEYALIVMECEEIRKEDIGLHQFITKLHPSPPLCWKGEVFHSLHELGEAIQKTLPEMNETLAELLSEDILRTYLKSIDMDKEDDGFFKEIEQITEQAKENLPFAYYRLGFLLLNTQEFQFNGNVYTTVDALLDDWIQQGKDIEQLATELLNNQYFFAWLTQLGYENHLKHWRTII